jgi:hypothetical protein
MALLYDGVGALKDRVIRVGLLASSCWQSGKPVSRCTGKIGDEIEINIFHRNAAHINPSFQPVVRGGVNIPAKIAKA